SRIRENSAKRSASTCRPFTPPSSTASATGGSSPLTPRSGSSPGWRSGSATPPPSSPWPCSHSAAWGPHYPEDDQYLTHGHGRRTSSETGQETYACWDVHKSPY